MSDPETGIRFRSVRNQAANAAKRGHVFPPGVSPRKSGASGYYLTCQRCGRVVFEDGRGTAARADCGFSQRGDQQPRQEAAP